MFRECFAWDEIDLKCGEEGERILAGAPARVKV